MSLKYITRDGLKTFLDNLIEERKVVGVKDGGGGKQVFDVLRSSSELVLDYKGTILPPKKYFFPTREALVKFQMGDPSAMEAYVEYEDIILFGVRPCDITAISLLDKVFYDGHCDPNYLARREHSTIIGIDCLAPCDEHSFCESVGSLEVSSGYDMLLTDIGRGYVVDVITSKGVALLAKYSDAKDATSRDREDLERVKRARLSKFRRLLGIEVPNLPLLFQASYDSPIWEELGERCLSCGSCNMVCPTCYCFDVQDVMDIDLSGGKRVRIWDGCQLTGFAKVATGENFREKSSDRVRHRMLRKFQYLMLKYGQSFCVGCGRCVRACLVNIDPADIVNRLVAGSQGG